MRSIEHSNAIRKIQYIITMDFPKCTTQPLDPTELMDLKNPVDILDTADFLESSEITECRGWREGEEKRLHQFDRIDRINQKSI